MKVALGFFFSSRRRHTRYWRDWSSDVCSSDLRQGTTITFDALYSLLESTRQENFLEAWSLSRNASQGGKPQVIIRQAEADPTTGELTFMLLDVMDMRTEQRFDILETDYRQYTLSFEHDFSDTLRIDGLIGRSESDFTNPEQTTVIID